MTCVGVTPDSPPDDPNKGGDSPPEGPPDTPPDCKCDDSPPPPPAVGDPINPGNGNKYQIETDYRDSSGSGELSLTRVYNSYPFNLDANTSRSFGTRWTFTYDAKVKTDLGPVIYTSYPFQWWSCYRRNDNGQRSCDAPSGSSPTPPIVALTQGNGNQIVLVRSSVTYATDADNNDGLTELKDASGNRTGWQHRVAKTGSTELFDVNGVLLNITARSGTTRTMTYSDGVSNDTSLGRVPADAPVCTHVQSGTVLPAGLLLCVTDNWGRQQQFEYDAKGRIAQSLDPANQAYSYTYDGASGGCSSYNSTNRACSANNLTSVTYPDGKSKTYYYNEATQINGGTACANTVQIGNGYGSLLNNLTGIADENGVRYASWTYDCQGLALSSELAAGVEKVSLSYGTPDTNGNRTNTITHATGTAANPQTTTRSFAYQKVLGVFKNTGIDQPCVECGPAKARTYDAQGNVATLTDWNGVLTTYGYDLTRNLETSRVEASGTPQVRTVMTTWHPTYRLPLSISKPLLRTTYTYDGSGNVLTKTAQATTDANGASGFSATVTGSPRVWTYTYNNVGQVLTVTGPRTDVTDVTTYTYDGSGNLSTVTNALGHVTTLSGYNANGRVGHITDPNGTTTDLAYSPRGWLTSRVVSSGTTVESTSYDYDGVGQLKLVTLPDGSSIGYIYDDAHRLTQVSDSLGNSITYVLDLRGNRTQEQVKDPSGNLARQVTRVYDTLSRLQQVTGAAQ